MENYKELFFRYLNNECTTEEVNSLLNWLHNPANAELIESLVSEDWDRFEVEGGDQSGIDRSFESLKQRLSQHLKMEPKRNYKIGKLFFRVAATFLLPVALGILTYYLLQSKESEEPVVSNEISVPLGSKTVVILGDGTKIWLNSGSKLKYPAKFQGNRREVMLTGEAFFDVKKDAKRPFIVKTCALNIKVLGTTFNVKSYPEEGTIETTLVNGAVTITKSNAGGKNKEAIYLKPNQRATYIKEEGKLILADVEKKAVKEEPIIAVGQKRKEQMILSNNVDIIPFTAWKDDKLVFKNEDFESLCTKLARWYNVKINIDNSELKKYHYTGILQKETINDVIEIIRLTMPFQYEVNHSVIDIWPVDSKKPDLNCQ